MAGVNKAATTLCVAGNSHEIYIFITPSIFVQPKNWRGAVLVVATRSSSALIFAWLKLKFCASGLAVHLFASTLLTSPTNFRAFQSNRQQLHVSVSVCVCHTRTFV